MNLQEIKKLAASDRMKQALVEVKKLHFSSELNDTFQMIEASFVSLQNDIMMGILSSSEKKQNSALIMSRFLNFLNAIESELETPSTSNTIIIGDGGNNTTINNVSNANVNVGTNKLNTEQVKKQKILFIYSCPKEKAQLDFGLEIKKIKKSLLESDLKQRDKFEIEVEEAVAADDLFRLIKNHQPAYIHIALHGSKSKGLLFQNNNGEEQPISKEDLTDFFELITMKNPDIQCVVLNACHSAQAAESITKYVRYAVGNQAAMPDEAAIAFTRGFYEMIFDGEEVDFAFKAAKLAVKIAKVESDDLPAHEIPVLYQQ